MKSRMGKYTVLLEQEHKKVGVLTPEMKELFADLSCQLSPENLSRDGELAHSKVRARRARLMSEWIRLERQVGRKVTEDEISDYMYQTA